MCVCVCVCAYSALQVSCLAGVENEQLSMSLYKQIAFVLSTITELSTSEPLPIYSFQWTTVQQSTVDWTDIYVYVCVLHPECIH